MADATALERASLTIRGVRAELVVEDGHLTLSKDGPPSTNLSFTVDRVRGTVLEPGSRGGRGWIHLAVVGGTLAPPGELAAMSDPYTIPLTPRSAVTARRLARLVEKHLHARGLPPEPTFAASALERGRFSSGVALTQAPGAVRTVGDLRADDRGPSPSPSPSPSRNGSASATGRSALPSPTSHASATPRDDEDDAPRAVRIAVAEAAIDERAAIGADPLGTSIVSAVDEPVVEPTGAPDGWLEPSGPSTRETTAPVAFPAASSSSSPDPPSPVGSDAAAGPSTKPTAPPPLTPPPTAPPPTVVGGDLATELRQLGELHASGVLTDAEFEQAKARVLR